MLSSSFGKKLKITIFGGSHEPFIGVTMEGLPKGFKVDLANISQLLQRRAPGQNDLSTPRKEPDKPVVRSGLHNGVTFGPPLSIIIENTDMRKKDYQSFYDIPRPAHADYTARVKYGSEILMSGGGPFSGRMTAPLCIAGAVAMQILGSEGIVVGAHIASIGDIQDTPFDPTGISRQALLAPGQKPFPTCSDQAGEKMRKLILAAKQEGDSVGGIIECCALGLPPGMGGPMYDGMESALSSIFFGIPAVKGVEFGNGFAATLLRGSENNDPFCADEEEDFKIKTKTNNHGGILGGISSGMPLIARVAFKPTPSIAKEQRTLRLSTKLQESLIISGRHDPCVVLRAVPVVEAAMAIGILDLMICE